MKFLQVVFLLSCSAAVFSGKALAAGGVQRFALIAGANHGTSDRPPLQYAVSDAERFARVLGDLGGVSPGDAILLRQPRLKDFVEALEGLRRRVTDARDAAGGSGAGRTEVLVYYSGHADEKGLLLGEDRYSYRSLRDRLAEVPADVRIAVLDACASGAITRLKGGRLTQPFLVDEAAEMRGYAFVTSSAQTEAAQESDHIRASYFTHYLISGLRGAADSSGDGKVTLNEAYHFAFNETLGRTVETKGGAQHPSYDINLSGTGDVVMTDLRQTSATLVLGEALDGRFFVRNAKQELVVELFKPYGRQVELGLEPGSYQVQVEREAAAFLAKPQLAEGSRVVLEPNQFTPTKAQPTRRRGGFAPPYAVTGRNRVELRVGVWRTSGDSTPLGGVTLGSDAVDFTTGFQYTRFLREHLAVTFAANLLPISGATLGSEGGLAGSVTVVALPLGLRWSPAGGELYASSLKPYLTAGLGPVIGESAGVAADTSGVFLGDRTRGTVGGMLGGGVDVHLNRRWSVGLAAVYNWMANFSDPIGGRDNYNGFDVRVSVGWLFGNGKAPRF